MRVGILGPPNKTQRGERADDDGAVRHGRRVLRGSAEGEAHVFSDFALDRVPLARQRRRERQRRLRGRDAASILSL